MSHDPDTLTLAIDIGGTHLKAGLLDATGKLVTDRARIATPKPATPDAVLGALQAITAPLGPFARISAGFPGMIRRGTVFTAPNLGTPSWHGVAFSDLLSNRFGKPARVLNDAEVQGLGAISGVGLECVITLGTGFGFALFDQGGLTPHLEVGQHIARGSKTYDEYVGNAARQRIGRKHWNRRIVKVIAALETLIAFDSLYIGGGNAQDIDIKLPDAVRKVANTAGITGGIRLWDKSLDAAF